MILENKKRWWCIVMVERLWGVWEEITKHIYLHHYYARLPKKQRTQNIEQGIGNNIVSH
ncbi:MAG: hypothetical protein F6K22_08100 [Okeania sp. SIO2F4]|uniref:hypothetical protein n=1 Tax=Okeania sp. SIO2F4 TaxID=2607790 RepID=UPI00142A757A|nr:hypothetical protein [Okeania sp. SIO2F4]NES02813.1 hypothetical protein [Okeania sp. SIO2F4]